MKNNTKHSLAQSPILFTNICSLCSAFLPEQKNPKSRNRIKMKINNFVIVFTISGLSVVSHSDDTSDRQQ